jgi:large subunit ribosomal protein L13
MRTKVVNTNDIDRRWYIVDAQELALGRLASKVANLLIGKHKPSYSPNQDHGDYIIVINADKVMLTGKKAQTKEYFWHSMHPGGGTFRPFLDQMKRDSTKVIEIAVRGMLPKSTLGRAQFRKLHVYSGETHPHAAQQPETLKLS